MAAYIYQLIDFLNGTCDTAKLSKEIQDSAITVALSSISINELDQVVIDFKTDLSVTDKSLLDTIVSNHDGAPLPITHSTVLLDENGNPISNSNPLRMAEAENPRDIWDKLMKHDTPRPPDCETYFTGIGDDPSQYNKYTDGTIMLFSHKIGDNTTDIITKYIDFNSIENKTYLFSAWISGYQCQGDFLIGELVNRSTPIVTGQTNTNYSLYGGYLIVPAACPLGEGAGLGTIDLTYDIDGSPIINPMECVIIQKTGKKQTGWWNINFNISTQKWENLTPVLDGTGNYNLFYPELVLGRFVSHFILLGNNTVFLNSFDTVQLPYGSRLKITVKRNLNEADHDFMVAINLYMHRQLTN